MDLAAWLRELGLERYEPTFRPNEVDLETLRELGDADLEELGLPFGPRKRLLKAIAALVAGTSTASAARGEAAPTTAPSAERRQLTVMFVDLVGSTALSSRLDPEELRAVMRSYQDVCAAEVGRFEGHVAKFLGDGILAYFGWPVAHEDGAERAVRAGLGIIEVVPGVPMPTGDPLAARIGIATGMVVVGDLLGEGAAREEAVVGETPNLAARLQQLAEPGMIIVADSTRRLLGQLFDLEDLGARALQGFPAPVRAWQVAGEGRTMGRFEVGRPHPAGRPRGRGGASAGVVEAGPRGQGSRGVAGGRAGGGQVAHCRASAAAAR